MTAKVRSVVAAADTGLSSPYKQTVTGSLGGSTPSAVILELTYSTTTTGSQNPFECASIGFSDGTTDACVMWKNEDVGTGNTEAESFGSASKLGAFAHPTTDSTLVHSITLDSFVADGCILQWDALPTRAVQMKLTFFVADAVEVIVKNLATSGTVGVTTETYTLTDTGLNPAFGMVIGNRAAAWSVSDGWSTTLGDAAYGCFVSDQAATPTIKQYAFGVMREDNDIRPYQGTVMHNSEESGGTARCFAYGKVPVADGSGQNELEVTDAAAGSFEVTRQNAIESSTRTTAALVVDFGGTIDVDLGYTEITTTAGLPTTTSVAGLGWQPQYYFWQMQNLATTGYQRGNLCAAVNLPGDPNGVLGVKSDNRQNNATDTWSYAHTSSSVCYLFDDSDTLTIDLTHSSFNAGGFTLAHTTFPASVTKVNSWVAFENLSESVDAGLPPSPAASALAPSLALLLPAIDEAIITATALAPTLSITLDAGVPPAAAATSLTPSLSLGIPAGLPPSPAATALPPTVLEHDPLAMPVSEVTASAPAPSLSVSLPAVDEGVVAASALDPTLLIFQRLFPGVASVTATGPDPSLDLPISLPDTPANVTATALAPTVKFVWTQQDAFSIRAAAQEPIWFVDRDLDAGTPPAIAATALDPTVFAGTGDALSTVPAEVQAVAFAPLIAGPLDVDAPVVTVTVKALTPKIQDPDARFATGASQTSSPRLGRSF